MIQHLDIQKVSQLFTEKKVFSIPKYQREYTWSKKNWEKLFDDIVSNEEEYFLGTILCVVSEKSNPLNYTEFELIDGQQRFTTLSLFLLALYNNLSRYKVIFKDDENRYSDYLNLKKEFVFNDNPRLIPQIQAKNQDDYNYILFLNKLIKEVNQPPYHGIRKIAKAYNFFNNQINEYIDNKSEEVNDDDNKCDNLFSLLKKVNSALLVVIQVSTNTDAYVLFEALNNSGEPLSAVDLIKNCLISKASKDNKEDEAYKTWKNIIERLGDEYTIHERFFRQFYNAFRDEINEPFIESKESVSSEKPAKYPVGYLATRTTLMKIYEKLINSDYKKYLEQLDNASKIYSILLNLQQDYDEYVDLKDSLFRLDRIRGVAAYILLLNIIVNKEVYKIDNRMLIEIIEYIVKFFVRRNFTDFPNTRNLVTIFMTLIEEIRGLCGNNVVEKIKVYLKEKSSSDSRFEESLKQDVYENNPDAVRFVLCYYEEEFFTRETSKDLWLRDKHNKFIWTIEHIFPEGENIPVHWVKMIGNGDKDLAKKIQNEFVHTLGNLTITCYNSSLSAKDFKIKKELKDEKGNPIGYNNGLNINREIYAKNEWHKEDIINRTDKLVKKFLETYKL